MNTAQTPLRSGFTLTEILIAVGIFSMVSTAMIAIMATAIDLYRAGEYARAANEEAMAVFGLLEKDIEQAVSPANGGHFYAKSYPDAGNCAVDWTIQNVNIIDNNGNRRDDNVGTNFVLWYVDPKNLLKAFSSSGRSAPALKPTRRRKEAMAKLSPQVVCTLELGLLARITKEAT